MACCNNDDDDSDQPAPNGVCLVRKPGSLLQHGITTFIEHAQAVDCDLAMAQWHAYCDALTANGFDVQEVDECDECPDAVFIEDPLCMFGDKVAVLMRSGAVERRAETLGAKKKLLELGVALFAIAEPGVMDGGDILKVGSTVYVGLGGRTNDVALTQLREIVLRETSFERVIGVPISKVLHLKSAITALPDETIIGFEPLIDDVKIFGNQFMAMPEEQGAHVVLLGGNKLLVSASAPNSIAKLTALGFECVVVDISEFEKLEGCVTCLSVRIRRSAAPSDPSASE